MSFFNILKLPYKSLTGVLTIVFVVVGLLLHQAKEIKSEKENVWESLESADCGVVLTGAAGRIREGFEKLAQKKIKKLIVSGVYKDSQLHDIFPYLPFYPEVNVEDIILEKRSQTTFGNARFSLSLVDSLNCEEVMLITSQVHMRRAYLTFEAVYPSNIHIKKLTVQNSKTEADFLGLFNEVVKSMFYHVLRLVDIVNL